jgi:hypothetical protein
MKLKIKRIVNDMGILLGVLSIIALNFIVIDATGLITHENFSGKVLCSLFFFVIEFFVFGIAAILKYRWIE